jgi:putative phosphoesterase
MKKIALISDNHSYVGDDIIAHLVDVDEIWHAGDIGELASIEKIRSMALFRAVYGNIDDISVKELFPLNNVFECEGMKILMTHIGGYPGKYSVRAKDLIIKEKPDIFICGHSHICKVMPDKTHKLIHMNPGSYGHYGFHKIRTLLKFEIVDGKLSNLRAIELGIRGIIAP